MEYVSELIRMTPKLGVMESPCEISPGHISQKHVEIEITKTTIVTVDGVAKPIQVDIKVRACHVCWLRFVYDATAVAAKLQ